MLTELKRLDAVIERLQTVRNSLAVNYALELRMGDSLGFLETASAAFQNIVNVQLKEADKP